jgi:hypothetical protein
MIELGSHWSVYFMERVKPLAGSVVLLRLAGLHCLPEASFGARHALTALQKKYRACPSKRPRGVVPHVTNGT